GLSSAESRIRLLGAEVAGGGHCSSAMAHRDLRDELDHPPKLEPSCRLAGADHPIVRDIPCPVHRHRPYHAARRGSLCVGRVVLALPERRLLVWVAAASRRRAMVWISCRLHAFQSSPGSNPIVVPCFPSEARIMIHWTPDF